MRVVCVALLSDGPPPHDAANHLTVGREYAVLEIYVRPPMPVSFRVECDDGTPGILHADLFEVTSDTFSARWSVQLFDAHTMMIGPHHWMMPGFWDDFFDGRAEAVADYESEKAAIEAES